MTVLNIKRAPSICNADGCLRPTVTGTDNILANIDPAYGVPQAIRAYVRALRDAEIACSESHMAEPQGMSLDEADKAVDNAFDRLLDADIARRRA